MRNEEGCGAINPGCSGVACSWSGGRGAAGEESPSDRYLSSSDAASESNRFEAIRLALRELGYLLKEAVPKVARVAVLYQSTIPSSVLELKDVLPVVARALGLTIQPWEVRNADGFEKVFVALNKERPDGLYVLDGGSLMLINRKRIAGSALKSRLPSVYQTRQAVEASGLMSYGAEQRSTGSKATR